MWAARLPRRPTPVRPPDHPEITVLKPLHGDEPGLFDNLASFCNQNYQGDVQIICGVRDANDRAVAVFKSLQNAYAVRDLELVVDATLLGSNHKVSNLANMAARIRHDVVLVADSDMRVDPDYLSRVVAALEMPGVGAVTCLYYGAPAAGIWAQLSALAINAHFLPSVVLGFTLGLARPCFGSTIALRREALAEIGGFRAFVDRLADDYPIGEALPTPRPHIPTPPFPI